MTKYFLVILLFMCTGSQSFGNILTYVSDESKLVEDQRELTYTKTKNEKTSPEKTVYNKFEILETSFVGVIGPISDVEILNEDGDLISSHGLEQEEINSEGGFVKLEPGTYFSKADSFFPIALKHHIFKVEDYFVFNTSRNLIFLIYIIMCLAVIFFQLIIFYFTKNKLFLDYAVFILTFNILGTMAVYGYTLEEMEIPSKIVILFQALMALSLVLFTKKFFLSHQYLGKINSIICDCFSGLLLLCAVVSVFYISDTFTQMMDLCSLLVLLYILFLSIYIYLKHRNLKSGIFFASWCFYLIGPIIFVLQDNGLIMFSLKSYFSMIAGNVFGTFGYSLLLGFVFVDKFNRSTSNIKLSHGKLINHNHQEVSDEIFCTFFSLDLYRFGESCDNHGSKKMFKYLREFYADIAKIVRKNKGSVDKSIGDELATIFQKDNHEDFAFKAAIEALEFNIDYVLKTDDELTLLAKYAVSTGETQIGDLGDQFREDISNIGATRNFVSRLLSACSPMRILVSEQTFKKILNRDKYDFHVKKIQTKESKIRGELVDAYECNPLSKYDKDIQSKIDNLLRFSRRNNKQESVRFKVNNGPVFATVYGDFKLLNYSMKGICLHSDKLYLGSNLEIKATNIYLEKELNEVSHFLFPVYLRVVWSQAHNNGYIHGCEYLHLSENNEDYLFSLLKKHASHD